MERTLRCFAIILAFCVLTSIAYVRISPEQPADANRHAKPMEREAKFSGQRHSATPAEKEASPTTTLASNH